MRYTNDIDSNLYIALKRTNDTTQTDLVDLVCKFKSCIYEGYKRNLLIWNEDEQGYFNRYGLKIIVDSKLVSNLSYQAIGASFQQNRPRLLIYKDILLKKGIDGAYEWVANTISVMDGFVTIDPELMLT